MFRAQAVGRSRTVATFERWLADSLPPCLAGHGYLRYSFSQASALHMAHSQLKGARASLHNDF